MAASSRPRANSPSPKRPVPHPRLLGLPNSKVDITPAEFYCKLNDIITQEAKDFVPALSDMLRETNKKCLAALSVADVKDITHASNKNVFGAFHQQLGFMQQKKTAPQYQLDTFDAHLTFCTLAYTLHADLSHFNKHIHGGSGKVFMFYLAKEFFLLLEKILNEFLFYLNSVPEIRSKQLNDWCANFKGIQARIMNLQENSGPCINTLTSIEDQECLRLNADWVTNLEATQTFSTLLLSKINKVSTQLAIMLHLENKRVAERVALARMQELRSFVSIPGMSIPLSIGGMIQLDTSDQQVCTTLRPSSPRSAVSPTSSSSSPRSATSPTSSSSSPYSPSRWFATTPSSPPQSTTPKPGSTTPPGVR